MAVLVVQRHLAPNTLPLSVELLDSMISITSYTVEEDTIEMPEGRGAWTATVGAKGQIVIPKEARDMFGIKPGDTLVILGDAERGLAIPPKEKFGEWISAVFDGGAR